MSNALELKCFVKLFTIFVFCFATNAKFLRKRQLFREQLLPNMGGKVPESAFWTDRLTLNQLNARGIYSSTGVYLEHRHNKVYNHGTESKQVFMQVRVPQEDRFVAAPGRYYFDSTPALDTTYVIRDPVSTPIKPNLLHLSHPLIPYTSLKLTRYYNQKKRAEKNKDSPWNDLSENEFSSQVKKEYEPYLKKLHEVDK